MSYIVMVMMVIIVLIAIRILRQEKQTLDRVYGNTAAANSGSTP